MKLTIDTQVDTQEDIKKVLFILTNILEKNNNSAGLGDSADFRGNFASSGDAADTAALMSMFGDDSAPAKEAVKDSNAPPDITSFFNAISEKEQKKEEPKIEYF